LLQGHISTPLTTIRGIKQQQRVRSIRQLLHTSTIPPNLHPQLHSSQTNNMSSPTQPTNPTLTSEPSSQNLSDIESEFPSRENASSLDHIRRLSTEKAMFAFRLEAALKSIRLQNGHCGIDWVPGITYESEDVITEVVIHLLKDEEVSVDVLVEQIGSMGKWLQIVHSMVKDWESDRLKNIGL
ncbi:hypothetical protein BDZ45DRAFT_776088, partial [Acephala macrosclerotiorum]